jgi:hypothetical protein
METGRLINNKLQKIYPAYRAALKDGLINVACNRDPRQNRLIIGNGGTPRLTITVGTKVYRRRVLTSLGLLPRAP